MVRVTGFAVLVATAGLAGAPVFALELDPKARAKAVEESAHVAAQVVSPRFMTAELVGGVDSMGRGFSGACTAASTSVCYDNTNGRIVYRGSRQWMPRIGELRPEHISVRKDKILFHYSFK